MGICIGWSAEHDFRGAGCDGSVDCCSGDSVFPAASGHGGCFAGADDHDELSHAETLHVNDVGRPGVGGAELTDVKEDRLGRLAGNLLCVRGFDDR